jgi:RimJ/RimL family protein N-acetyltransferase
VSAMHIDLTPLAGEPEPNDPAYAGEWAGALEGTDYGTPPWCYNFARFGKQPLGIGLFKGPPADGVVEIAYLAFIGARRRGAATAIASQLVSIARGHGMKRVVAHTLRENNPSTLVLTANGFMGPTEVVDPEDGPVWRWELAL